MNSRTLSRTIGLIGSVWLGWVAVFSAALSASPAAMVEGPKTEIAADGAATVTWKTDVPTAGRFDYGMAPQTLDRRRTTDVSESHSVTLTNLESGARYFFSIGSARQLLATNSFRVPPRESEGNTPANSAQRANGNAVGTNPTTPTTPTPASAPQAPAPPAKKTWGNLASLADHFHRHGPDFKARNAEDYARLAWAFLQRARRDGLPAKFDKDGTIRVYERQTRTFAAYNRNGTTKTFFKPESPDYFERQPGRSVDLRTFTFR